MGLNVSHRRGGLDNGGGGLIPGEDLGGLLIDNSHWRVGHWSLDNWSLDSGVNVGGPHLGHWCDVSLGWLNIGSSW